MNQAVTRGKKLLFATPLLLLAIGGGFWRWQNRFPEPLALDLKTVATVEGLQFSPDSKQLVALLRTNGSSNYTGQVFDLQSHKKLSDLSTKIKGKADWNVGTESQPFWSPDGGSIMSGTGGWPSRNLTKDRVAVWNPKTGNIQYNFDIPLDSGSYWNHQTLRYSPDGKTFIGSGLPPAIYDKSTGKRLNKPENSDSQRVYGISNDKLELITTVSVRRGRLQVEDSKSGLVIWEPMLDNLSRYRWADDVLFLIDEYRLPEVKDSPLNGATAHRMILWDGRNRKQLPAPAPDGSSIGDFSFNPAQSLIAYSQFVYREPKDKTEIVSTQSQLKVWDYRANRAVWQFETNQPINSLKWSPNGKWLMGVAGNNLYVFDANGNLRYQNAPIDNRSPYQTTVWSPDSAQLATVVVDTDEHQTMKGTRIKIHRLED